MCEKEIDKHLDETMKSIEEKEEKSTRRLQTFLYLFMFIGLVSINFMLQMKIHPIIMIIIIDLFVLFVSVKQHKLGLKIGSIIEKEFLELDHQSSKEREDRLLKTIFELRKNQSVK